MKSMILGISASPQKGGNVEKMVQEVLSASRLPSGLVRLHDISVGPCTAYNACSVNNKCVIKDDWKTLRTRMNTGHTDEKVLGRFAGRIYQPQTHTETHRQKC